MNTKKTQLLAAAMVFAVAFAGVTVLISDDADAIESVNEVTVDGYTLKLPSSVDKDKMEGFVTAGELTSYGGQFSEFGDEAKYFGAVSIKGDSFKTVKDVPNMSKIYVEQTNSALEIYKGDNNIRQNADGTWMKFADRSEVNDEYSFLIPTGTDKTVSFKVVYKDSGNKELKTEEFSFDFSNVSTKITLTTDAEGDAWKYTSINTTLTLDSYDGSELFYATGALNVVLKGENVMNVYGVPDKGAGEGSRAIYAGGALTIKAEATAGASLKVTQNTINAFTITGASISVGDASGKKVTIVTEGGNRGLYSTGDMTIANANVTCSGSEKGIRSGGNLSVTGGSVVDVKVDGTGYTNGATEDDLFGAKVKGTVTVEGSTMKAHGLHVEGVLITCNSGKILVYGDYEQSLNSKIEVMIAGLYADNLSETKDVYRVSSDADAKDGEVSLIGDAEAFGDIVVKNTSEQTTEMSSDDKTAVEKALKDKNIEVVTFVPASTVSDADFTVPAGKELVIVTGSNTISGKIATGTGADKQTITLKDFKGSFTITKGSVIIESSQCSGTITAADGTTVVLNIAATNGNLVLATEGESDFIVKKNKTLDIGTNALTISKGVTLTVEGEITGSVKEMITGNGIIALGVNGKLTCTSGTTGDSLVKGVTTKVDPSVMKDQGVTGSASKGTTVYPVDQIITVNGTWTLEAGCNITILGQFVVPEGCKVIVQNKAILNIAGAANAIIDGDIVLEATYKDAKGDTVPAGIFAVIGNADVALNGDVQINGTISLEAGERNAKLTISGSATIGSDGVFNYTSGTATVAENASLTINGIVTPATKIYNYGNITVNSDTVGNGFTVMQMLSGAVVDIVKFTGGKDCGAITIFDNELFVTYQKEKKFGNDSTVTVDPNAVTGVDDIKYTVSNVKVVTTAKLDKNKDLVKSMDVSGAIKASNDSTTEDKTNAKVTLAGSVTVSDSITVGKYVTVENGAKLVITGTIDASAADSTFSNTVAEDATKVTGIVIKDTGSIVKYKTALTGEINAAVYKTETADTAKDTLWNYVTIDAALTAAKADAKITAITVYGQQELTASNDVPAKVVLTVSGELLVGCADHTGVILNVDAEGTVKADGKVDVDGTLYAENKSKVTGTILSDVKSYEISADGKVPNNGWAKWTNLATALAEAQSGETIEVSTDKLDIKTNLTVPAGVTVKVASETEFTVYDGITLTVNGTIVTDADIKAQHKFATTAKNTDDVANNTSVLIVNGAIKSTIGADYANTDGIGTGLLSSGAPIAGAYYEEGEYSVVSPVSVALDNIADITSVIEVKGEVSVGDIAFTATDDCSEIEIVGGAKLTASSVTLSGSALKITGEFAGSIVIADITIALKNVTGLTVSDVEGVMTFSGDVADADTENDENASITLVSGKLVAKSSIGKATDINNNVDLYTGVDFIVASGSTLVSEGANINGKLVIEGTVSVASGKTFNATGDVIVMDGGVLSAAAGTSTASPATASIIGDLYVGSATQKETTGAGAAVSGPITGAKKVFIAGGSTMDAEAMKFLKDYKTTEFYVDDALWMTVYTVDASVDENAVTIDSMDDLFDIPAENAVFDKWVDEKGENVGDNKVVGDYAKLTAVVTTDIYNIRILANAGINDITIDGNLMAFIDGYYVLSTPLAAGTHTIEYTLANGYSGEAKLAINGDVYKDVECTTSGMSFTLSGVPANVNEDTEGPDTEAYVVTFQLTGIEKSGYVPDSPDTPATDDGMTITDYLLIILVVLIVVMAIIVAMRLMRS